MSCGSHAPQNWLFIPEDSSSRVQIPDGVWACWRCGGTEDIARVSDLSVGGLFLSTPVSQPVGVKAQLDFLVQEGNIRVEAEVRHLAPSGGLGLKFTAISDKTARIW